MNTDMLRDDVELNPWGIVTPNFWARDSPVRPAGEGAAHLVSQPPTDEASPPLAVLAWFGAEGEESAGSEYHDSQPVEPGRLQLAADHTKQLPRRAPAPVGDPRPVETETPEEVTEVLVPGPVEPPAPAPAPSLRQEPAKLTQQYDTPGTSRAVAGGEARSGAQGEIPAGEQDEATTRLRIPTGDPAEPGAQVVARRADSEGERAGRSPVIPEEYRARIDAIAAISTPDDAAGLAKASIEAETLDQELTARFGAQHSHTVNIREIRGWLALLAGHPDVAARWYLHTTGIQMAVHGPRHASTESSVRRALGSWQQVTDDRDIVQIGLDLAKVVPAVLGEGSPAVRFVEDRISRHRPQ